MAERTATHDRHLALEAVRQSYDALSTAVLSAARERGYLGADAARAAETLALPDPDLARLGAAAADLWLAFFACFHPRLAPLDSGQFQGGIDALNQRLRALPPGTPPDPVLAADLLVTLEGLWNDRHEEVARQLDRLVAEAPGGSDLASAIDAALVDAGLVPAQGEGAGQRLARVLAHLRHERDLARQESRETTAAVGAFLRAVKAVAAGQQTPALPGPAGSILASVGALDAARREQEKDLRALRAQLQAVEIQRQEAVAALARAEQAVPPPESAGDAEARLVHYRAALAAWEGGEDPGPHLAKARDLERVVTLTRTEEARLIKVLDRFHADAVRQLVDLHGVLHLTDDPRRYRPRGLLGLGARPPYDLRSVVGLVEALLAAGRDLDLYAERAVWSLGVGALAAEAPRIRTVFAELVKLVAHWREKLGDPPPVSVSMSLDGGSGIVALPAVVATDIEAMTRRKTKVGPAAQVLAPLLADCVALYHQALAKAGAPVPARVPAKPRESPIQALTRLAAELDQLAGVCEACFAAAARDDFRPSAGDVALQRDDHLLRAGLQALDEAATELAQAKGAPALPVADPPKRGDPAALRAVVRGRVAWFQALARYRIVIG